MWSHAERSPAPEAELQEKPAPKSKLKVGRADDKAEVEADRFAAGLLNDLKLRPAAVRREASGSVADPLGGTAVDTKIESRIRSASGGQALPDDIRRSVEERSGRDL